MRLKTTLEQWATLLEVDKAGSIQAAALQLNKSHTTLIYSLKKLEEQLDVSLLKVASRRSILTDDGKSLLRRAHSMIEQAKVLEDISTQLAQGAESEVVIAIDHLCDRKWLYQPLETFFTQNSSTSIQIVETSLSKTQSMVEEANADISIITLPITNYPCESFGIATMLPVAAINHPLANKPELCLADLTVNRQIVVRDLGKNDKKNVGWLKSNQRITVDNFDHAWQAVKQGLGYCRFPKHIIENYSDEQVVILNIEYANCYQVPLHLTLPKGAKTGPAAKNIYQLLLTSVNQR
ncbi:MAG: LysR family transcriptional regulator [Colwellia sp.]|nr:LysR family transcriptional regulator [Colwellia sp.]MCW9080511.1 LysR family transcriptional regulator [Colwellia sp.]